MGSPRQRVSIIIYDDEVVPPPTQRPPLRSSLSCEAAMQPERGETREGTSTANRLLAPPTLYKPSRQTLGDEGPPPLTSMQTSRWANNNTSILKRLRFGTRRSETSCNAAPAQPQHTLDSGGESAPASIDHSDVTLQNAFRCWPSAPRTVAVYDCASLAAVWGVGERHTINAMLDGARNGPEIGESTEPPLPSSSNSLIDASSSKFRVEFGAEETRRLALSRASTSGTSLRCNSRTWHREANASEAGVLENLSNVYLGGRLCASRQPAVVIESVDPGAYYYRHCFAGRPHHNYFGIDDQLGPVAISVVREKIPPSEAREANLSSAAIYRVIMRVSDLKTIRASVPEDAVTEVSSSTPQHRTPICHIVGLVYPHVHTSCLRHALPVPHTEEMIIKLDEQPIWTRYKMGVLLCRAGQSTEEEMYNNEHSSPILLDFLDMLGQRVRLKGFEGYRGGLDARGDTTGTHSVYCVHQQNSIMLHVSTMMPFTPSNKQQLHRKRHIGNDMVTIVLQEPGALPFDPTSVRSHFQQVFVVVRANEASAVDHATTNYTMAVARAVDVPTFGPRLPRGATFTKSTQFRDFLLTKCINAENAVHRSAKFAAMSARTRRDMLKELVEKHSSTTMVETQTKLANRLLGQSAKRKERPLPRPLVHECLRSALSWGNVAVEDNSSGERCACVLGVSVDSVVLVDRTSADVVFATPTHSVIGWHCSGLSIKLFHDHGAVLTMHLPETSSSIEELALLLARLAAVTNGAECRQMNISHVHSAQEIHLQSEGIVTDVEMYSKCWTAGLRQGSRIVQVSGTAVCSMSLQQLKGLLLSPVGVPALVIPPADDGSPRRGCEDVNCAAIRGAPIVDEIYSTAIDPTRVVLNDTACSPIGANNAADNVTTKDTPRSGAIFKPRPTTARHRSEPDVVNAVNTADVPTTSKSYSVHSDLRQAHSVGHNNTRGARPSNDHRRYSDMESDEYIDCNCDRLLANNAVPTSCQIRLQSAFKRIHDLEEEVRGLRVQLNTEGGVAASEQEKYTQWLSNTEEECTAHV